jgi:hypothetical protein
MPCPLLQLFLEVPTDTNYSKTMSSTQMLTQERVYEKRMKKTSLNNDIFKITSGILDA